MTDHETNHTETPEAETLDTKTPDAKAAETTDGGGREWIVPAAVLGAVVLLAAVFAAGFFVGRGTAPENEPATAADVLLDDLLFQPFGQERFQRFRTPRNDRFDSAPERRPFGGRGPLLEGRLDQLCDLLDDEAIPQRVPFYDRLIDACADRA